MQYLNRIESHVNNLPGQKQFYRFVSLQQVQIICSINNQNSKNINLWNMQANFIKLVRWIKPPPQLKIDKPFIKGLPIKPLDNNRILYQIETEVGKKQVPISITDSFEISADNKLYEDMCHMTVLNEPEVLNNLIQRYRKELIFTYIGPTLIIVNPYEFLPQFFDKNAMLKIRQKIVLQNLENDEPHAFMTAGKAYLHMKKSQKKQAIVISGESGAGKTESTKYCMQILTSLSHQENNSKGQTQSHSIEAKILSCNPLLQAFGNSKTVRNDNSSRFGKYVQMYFGKDNTIKGANILSYLLQKSRVVSISKGERSFHAFYALTASKKFNIKQARQYDFLKQSQCYSASGINDADNFIEINRAMDQIQMNQAQKTKIWLLLKTILELGNLKFDDKKQETNEENPCEIVNKQLLKPIAQNLQIKMETLQNLLVFEKKIMLKQAMLKAYKKKQGCIGHRNTLCKAIYNAVFEFILHKIQISLRPTQMHHFKSINILDIFGFQNFTNNSFEQLCINFTNQKLLKLYNEYIFKRQMQLLSQDGLQNDIKSIKPPTNDDIINILSGGVSIFSIVTDNTTQQQFTDQNIKDSIQNHYKNSTIVKLEKNKDLFFTIRHSQCEVKYNIQGFKMKNLDKVNDDVVQILNNLKVIKTGNKTVQEKNKTLLKKFASQIETLIKELSSSNVHFVRCIKPNEQKRANYPVNSYILSQVRYLGVFETIQIRKKTFPVRKDYQQFTEEYKMLFAGIQHKFHNHKKIAEEILKSLKCQSHQYMLGHKRVYINERIESVLNKNVYEYYKKRNQQIKKIQLVCKRFTFTSKVSRKVRILINIRNLQKVIDNFKLKLKKVGFSKIELVLKLFKEAEQKKIKQAELKAKKDQQQKKKALKQSKKSQPPVLSVVQTLQKTNFIRPNISPARLKQLQSINQKFFKYSRPITKAYTKLSRARYFLQLKKAFSTQSTDIKATKNDKKSKSKEEAQINQTVIVQAPQNNPSIFKLKNSVPKPPGLQNKQNQKQQSQQNKFSESFYNEESVYIPRGADVIFTGNLKIQMFENSKEAHEKLTLLKTILGQKYKSIYSAQSQVCSPHSEDSNFKIQETPQQIMSKVINFPIDDFFHRILRKRTGVFGMKKDYSEILTFKPRPLTKTLTQLTNEEEAHALKVFKLLIKIGEETSLDNVFKLVDNVMRYCQQTSQALKNQILLQLIKQSNNESEVPAIRIYQTFSVYLHIYTPDEDFIFAGLHIFFNKIALKKHHQKQEEFLRYLFKKMIRKIQKPHGVGYMPIKYQIMALMSKRQISIPIYLPIGNNILVKAQSYETFSDIKIKVLEELGINTSRIPPQFFAFFEVVNYENTELEQSPVNQNSVIWDVMTYWELAKEKYQQSGVPPPYFSIMIKIKFPFQCTQDDEQTIQIYFAQCYFDYSMGRIRLQLRQMSMLAACIKKIKLPNQSNDDIEGCFPLWMSKMYDKQTFKKYILDNLAWLEQNNLDSLAMKYKFLQICSESPLALTFAIPTEHSLKLFLKPKRIYLVEKGTIVGEYSIREIAKWSNNNESFNFQIKRKDGSLENKTHMIMTQYSHMCTDYLNKVSQYLLKYGGRGQKIGQKKILKGI